MKGREEMRGGRVTGREEMRGGRREGEWDSSAQGTGVPPYDAWHIKDVFGMNPPRFRDRTLEELEPGFRCQAKNDVSPLLSFSFSPSMN